MLEFLNALLGGTVARALHYAQQEVVHMLYWALMFLVVGLIAAALGFTNIAGGAFAIAKFIAGLFLVLFVIFLVLALTAAKKIID